MMCFGSRKYPAGLQMAACSQRCPSLIPRAGLIRHPIISGFISKKKQVFSRFSSAGTSYTGTPSFFSANFPDPNLLSLPFRKLPIILPARFGWPSGEENEVFIMTSN